MRDNPRKNRRQKKSLLSKTRWAAYAAAGAATALGANEAAEAGIIYHSSIDFKLDAATSTATTNTAIKSIDVNGDLTNDLQFIHRGIVFSQPYGPYGVASVAGVSGGKIAAFTANGYPYAYNLAKGNPTVSSGRNFLGTGGTMAFTAGFTSSQFLDAGEGFVGFSFDAGQGTQYGWLAVQMTGQPHNAFTILDWAYADPGEAITAGEGRPVPEPGSLGLLATGALGLLLWRRSRRGKQPAA